VCFSLCVESLNLLAFYIIRLGMMDSMHDLNEWMHNRPRVIKQEHVVIKVLFVLVRKENLVC